MVAWVQRFIQNFKSSLDDRWKGDLSFDELPAAKQCLICAEQETAFSAELDALRKGSRIPKSSPVVKLSPFVAEDGFLRIQGRLQFSQLSWEEKHPRILPKSHLILLLPWFQHSLMKHAGMSAMISSLRNQFWILGVRHLAKRVKRECVHCKRQDLSPCQQPMGPLPDLRDTQSSPFAVTGLDHAGPLYCCDFPRKKFWVLIFTCGVIRAVHLELVESLSTEQTLLALRRSASRRGLPRVIFSDTAKGFIASPQQLQKQFGHVAPDWRFIAPHSPWWGGWWERLIRSMKSSLKKTFGRHSLTRTELETTLHDVESCVNSRPLTYVSDEANVESPLTPAHFLLGHTGGFYERSTSTPVVSGSDLPLRFATRQSLLDKFWEIWSSDYIRNLPPQRGAQGECDLPEGSVVLVQDDQQPRLRRQLGVITQLFPGRDGVVRTVEVKTASGKLVCSIPRIHDLEILSGSVDDVPGRMPSMYPPETARRPKDQYVTSRGGVVKAVQRLDL